MGGGARRSSAGAGAEGAPEGEVDGASAGAGPREVAVTATARHPGDVGAALDLAAEIGAVVPLPGAGRTAERWDLLARVAEIDLTTARVLEPHLDALAILAEAPEADRSAVVASLGADPRAGRGRTWGVFAAEAADAGLDASPVPGDGKGWLLRGRKPWCSLAGRLSHALVTAVVPEGGRRLFAVALDHPGVQVVQGVWHARGLSEVASGPVDFHDVPAVAVGPTGWYLSRPGFWHGGIGVAACWLGGALGVAAALRRAARTRTPDQLALWHLGQCDVDLFAARTCLDAAARAVDAGEAVGDAGAVLAARVRAVVADAAESVLGRVGHALGPAPLALDAAHARRVADLTLYLRQHHAERDVARLGEQVLALAASR